MTNEVRSPRELLDAYRRGPALLREALGGLDSEALRARPVPGKLSSLEVACHIVDSDQFMCDRIKRTIATWRPLLIGVESIDYVAPLSYQEHDLDLDLGLLDVQRDQMAADLERLPQAAWARTAVHSENGLQTLADIVAHAVDHLEDHVERILEKKRVLGL
jgi:hypothetical protein